MEDTMKTREQLLDELKVLRQRVADLERSEDRVKRAEEDLTATREYARNIIDSSHDMIITVDNARKIVEFNRAAEKTFGYRKEEVLGKHVSMLYLNPEEGDLGSKTTHEEGEMVSEVTNIRKDKTTFPSFLSATVLRNAKGERIGTMGISRDMTDRRRAEEEKLRREKMQGVLEMAGAACHELNQPMQTIASHAELGLKEITNESPLRKRLEIIHEQISRMAGMTKKINRITKYETRDYIGGIKIIDIDKSSEQK